MKGGVKQREEEHVELNGREYVFVFSSVPSFSLFPQCEEQRAGQVIRESRGDLA